MDEKPLQVLCAEAEGWRAWLETRGEHRGAVGIGPGEREPWMNVLPPFGWDCAEGRALAVDLMQRHKINLTHVPSDTACDGPGGGPSGPHWTACADDPRDPDGRLISRCGATISEAVARCRVALAEAEAK